MDVGIQAEVAAVEVAAERAVKVIAEHGSASNLDIIPSAWVPTVSVFVIGGPARAPGDIYIAVKTETTPRLVCGVV